MQDNNVINVLILHRVRKGFPSFYKRKPKEISVPIFLSHKRQGNREENSFMPESLNLFYIKLVLLMEIT